LPGQPDPVGTDAAGRLRQVGSILLVLLPENVLHLRSDRVGRRIKELLRTLRRKYCWRLIDIGCAMPCALLMCRMRLLILRKTGNRVPAGY